MSKCYLCHSADCSVIHNGTRDVPDLNILKCNNCGLVFLSSFAHINENIYKLSKMHKNQYAPPVVLTNFGVDNIRRYEMLQQQIKGKNICDFGCGSGEFLRLAAQTAQVSVGIELDEALKSSLQNEGYRIFSYLEECNQSFDTITLFHVLEHLTDPVLFMKKFIKYLKPEGKIIIETPNANDALLSVYHCENFADFTYWSFHVMLYTVETLAILADKAGLQVKWSKQVQRYPLANHLYWLTAGRPGGQVVWDFMRAEDLDKAYTDKLCKLGSCDTIVTCLEPALRGM